MAPIYTPVSAIVAGKIKLKLKVRVVHMWTVPDFNIPNEESFLHMLLLDERVRNFANIFFFRVQNLRSRGFNFTL